MRAQELELDNRHLRDTLNDCNRELKDVKNQEVTIKILREKVRDFEEKAESTIQARTRAREEELSNRFAEKERELLESRSDVDQRLEEAERKVAQLQSALESTQSELFVLKSKYDEVSHAKSDEMEIIVNDLERANQRAAVAEREVSQLAEQLRAAKQSLQLADQIQSAPDMERAVDVVARSALELELAAKDKEISQLVDDIQRLHSTLNSLKETSASKIAQLEGIVNEKDKRIVELGEKLVKQHDYDVIKKELSILKSVELCGPRPWENGEESKSGEVVKPVETLPLQEKTKPLQTDTTSLKVAKTEATTGSQQNFPLQSVDSFGIVLGQELVTDYAHVTAKEEIPSRPSTPVMTKIDSITTNDTEDRKPSPVLEPPNSHVTTSHPNLCTTVAVINSPPLPLEQSPTATKEIVIKDNTSLEKLQECLRHNIDKYANETLNTLNIARCVRELLSVHNIGQRLFAKFVLGLSQGTVSELLSKPKPWDKLTEKGRDSYRKMHAWASDDHCIFMLKSLVPRRGKESGGGGMQNFKQDDQGAEERIAQILNEAQMAMLNAKQLEHKNPSTSLPNGSLVTTTHSDTRSMDSIDDNRGDCGDKNSSNNGGNNNINSIRDLCSTNSNSPRRSRKYENDDIPQEMVARIYQEELAKLIGQRVEEGFRTPRDQYERTQEEIRQALTIYHQELTRLSHLMPQNHPNSFNPFSANGNTFAGSLAHHHNNNGNSNTGGVTAGSNSNGTHHHHTHHLPPPPQECPVDATIGTRTRPDSKTNSSSSRDEPELRHHGSAFSLVRPKTEPNTSTSSTTHNKTSSTTPSYHLHNSSPAPPPLLPLADTSTPGSGPPGGGGGGEDLSTSASPLQRMQSITNSLLSQSSVPSMPNPPQRPAKAVLPPITQQQFDQYNNLNTEDIVKKVKEQLSQYSISQRLFGESVLGLSQGSVSDLLARPKPWHMLTQKGREPFIRMKIFLEDDNAVHKLVASQYKIAPEKLMRTGGFGGTPNPPGMPSYGDFLPFPGPNKMSPRPPEPNHRVPETRQPTPNNSLYTSQPPHPPRTSCVTPDTMPISLTVSSPSNTLPATPSALISSRKLSTGLPRGYSQPSVYEMAALTTDLDTQVITSKIKETLMAHNIGQKIFGEVVLGLSQGSVSELLSKPKPWHMLSIKGREPFIRMQMWLNDPHNVEMLQSIKNERREANKRRRTGDGPMDSPRSQSDSQLYGYNFAPPSPYPPAKKPRVLFTEEQKEALRLAFSLDPYPSTATIEFLATELNLSVRTITNWFHNHRMRMKQHGNSDDERKPSSDVTSSGSLVQVREGMAFDPVHYRVLLNQRLADKFREKGGPPFLGNFGGSVPYLYSPYRNCSPLSSSGDDMGTLDLSMSSQLRNAINSGGGIGSKMDNTGSSTDDRSNSEMNDDSNLSQDQLVTEEGSDRDSPDDCRHSQSDSRRVSPLRQPAEQVRLTTTTGGSSNRRKPAMPQWVDPGLELSPDSDVHTDEEDEDNEDPEEIINGVCVRQTEDFDLLLPREETIHVVPAPAPDTVDNHRRDLTKHRPKMAAQPSRVASLDEVPSRELSDNDLGEDDEITNGNECPRDEDLDLEEDVCKKDSKKMLMDDDESWDDAEAKDRRKNIEKLQQRLEKEDAGEEWEF